MIDGEAEALRRIAAEARDQTGSLDLGGLGLRVLPPSLFNLHHLRRLNLGQHLVLTADGVDWNFADTRVANSCDFDSNDLQKFPGRA
jgi:hypothetical protein